eukprot:8814362-Alexandrium_andersonii.AAC.1
MSNHPELLEEAKAVWPSLVRLHSPKAVWARVCGHVSACVATLKDNAWSPIAPDSWVAPDGSLWTFTPGAPVQQFADAFALFASARLWKQASAFYEGGGLEVVPQ